MPRWSTVDLSTNFRWPACLCVILTTFVVTSFGVSPDAVAGKKEKPAKEKLSPIERLKTRSPSEYWSRVDAALRAEEAAANQSVAGQSSDLPQETAPGSDGADPNKAAPSGTTATKLISSPTVKLPPQAPSAVEPTEVGQDSPFRTIVEEVSPLQARLQASPTPMPQGLPESSASSVAKGQPSPAQTAPLPSVFDEVAQPKVTADRIAHLTSKYQNDNDPVVTNYGPDPSQLKKITEIAPFSNYEPDAESRETQPCRNLCPYPGSALCKGGEDQVAGLSCPEEIRLGQEVYAGRAFDDRIVAWQASNVYHNPLYFEDVQLERYGHTYGDLVIQPFVSAGKFALQLAGFPYQTVISPLNKRTYPLGVYRPGDWAPGMEYQIPLNLEAALFEAEVVSGLVWVLP
mgnify:CR=1 FL=1